ncbi:hypothetical protein [Nostoc sp. 'Lobaria pulmonaria (5183) cyanobiont']|uniref:hypothetical protein n=1 Tax=Nostoc sp. 'Lobaria pulmonaria (5183) cyanobiont' TaxID=1618022 RepID=UPI001F420957|nr:hypothetical protein [Nostoc sp. 'Lobaria pulmonaria (5183) cyanobiont']
MRRKKDTLCTEFAFTLPRGLSDGEQRVHRHGVMRLATAKDEILVQQERKVQENPAYGVLVMLARVLLAWAVSTLLVLIYSKDCSYMTLPISENFTIESISKAMYTFRHNVPTAILNFQWS